MLGVSDKSGTEPSILQDENVCVDFDVASVITGVDIKFEKGLTREVESRSNLEIKTVWISALTPEADVRLVLQQLLVDEVPLRAVQLLNYFEAVCGGLRYNCLEPYNLIEPPCDQL